MKKLVAYTALVTVISFALAGISSSFVKKEDFKNLKLSFKWGNAVDSSDLEKFETEKEFSFSTKGRLKIHFLDGKVQVRPVQGDQIKIYINGKVDRTKALNIDDHINQNGDNVLVNLYSGKVTMPSKWFGFQSDVSSVFPNSVNVEIEVPPHFEEIEINGMSARVDVQGVNPKRAEFKVVDGRIKLDALKSELIEVKSVSGNIDLINSSAKRFSIHAVSADVDFQSNLEVKYAIKFESLAGKLKGQELFNAESAQLFEVNTVSGDVEFTRD